MIPVLIVFGLIFGHWWRTTLAAGVTLWVAALLTTDVIGVSGIPAAAAFALVNTGLGVSLHQAVLAAMRLLRDGSASERGVTP